MFCQFYKVPAYRGGPIPRTTGAPVVVVDGKFIERITRSQVLAALAGTVGRQRKSRGAGIFDGFAWARTSSQMGWQTATYADLFNWLCWLDLHGSSTKLVHIAARGWVRTATHSVARRAM